MSEKFNIIDEEINIQELKFPNNIRKRLGMFLGSSENPDVALREVIDNAVDELFGYTACDKVDIQIKSGQKGSWYVVSDNGRGFPILLDNEKGITKVELAMTTLNAGSKFESKGNISNGLNGVGASAVNAVSNRYVVLSKITNKNFNKSIKAVEDLFNSVSTSEMFYFIEFAKGIKVDEGALLKNEAEVKFGFEFPEGMSTIAAFIPDDTIWKSTVANYNKKALSYVQVILKKFYDKEAVIIIDGKEVSDQFEPYAFEFIKEVKVDTKNYKGEDIHKNAKFYINFDVDSDLSVHDTTGSVNSLIVNRGLHINYIESIYKDALKSHYNIQHDYTYCGLKLNVICLTPNADYSSQTKERCTKIDDLTYEEVYRELACEFHNIFADNNDYFETHVKRLNEYYDSIQSISAIQKVKQVVGTVDGGNRVRSKLPSSVKDASSNNRSDCELFLVEGKSASGTMLKARNPEIHAILELRGMVMNSINSDLDQIMDNAEMCSIITAIGAGVNEYFNIDNCRYGKIILSADSDYYGEKINAMLLGFITKKMTFLVKTGKVYIALAPLFHQGDVYVYPGQDPKDYLDYDKPFRRYKGIGEINIKEAKDFYFNPDTRNLLRVTLNNADYVFELLTSTYQRKQLMITNDIIIDKYNTGIL